MDALFPAPMRSRSSFLYSLNIFGARRGSSIRRFGSILAIAVVSLTIPACRQAAFNEYYVESMASEIRALEDRIYEYDSAYQSLELENEDLRAKHERLQRKLRELEEEEGLTLKSKPSRTPTPNPKPNQDAVDSETFELVPPPKTKTEEPAPIVPRTPVAPPTEPTTDPSSPPTEVLPGILPPPANAPATKDPTGTGLPKASESEILPPPAHNGNTSIPNRSRNISEFKTNDLVEEYTTPPTVRSAQQPNASPLLKPPAVFPNQTNPSPRLPTLPSTTPGSIIQGQIRVPKSSDVVQASATELVHQFDGGSIDAESIVDRRVVGIEFHPTLCRGINLDNQPGDDGLYLVITPKNQAGQTINDEGHLTIVAEELGDDKPVRISAWEIDPEEMKEYLEPIGASQGYHLRLPWNGSEPKGRTIQVFVKCEFEDGRKPVNRKELTLSKSNIRPLTWTPRQ
ncbi:MAG: hypothetical protein ACK5PB_04770 [Pirellula sp.]|jgi:hypothetical protein